MDDSFSLEICFKIVDLTGADRPSFYNIILPRTPEFCSYNGVALARA